MMAFELPTAGVRWALGIIAITLTAVEFSQFALGRSLHHLTFLGVHVGAATAVTFFICGWRGRRKADAPVPLHDLALAAVALVAAGYFALQGPRVTERIAGVDEVFTLDIAFGIVLIVVLLEACRRIAGIVLTVIAILFIGYILLGPYLPGSLEHRGLNLMRFIDVQVLSTQGIFGTPISASAHQGRFDGVGQTAGAVATEQAVDFVNKDDDLPFGSLDRGQQLLNSPLQLAAIFCPRGEAVDR
jgi:TRAP-type uncharacterized transport system fused permease subunit